MSLSEGAPVSLRSVNTTLEACVPYGIELDVSVIQQMGVTNTNNPNNANNANWQMGISNTTNANANANAKRNMFDEKFMKMFKESFALV